MCLHYRSSFLFRCVINLVPLLDSLVHTAVDIYFMQIDIPFLACPLFAFLRVFLFVVLFFLLITFVVVARFHFVPLSPVHRVSPLQLPEFQHKLAHHHGQSKVQCVLDGIAHPFSSGFDASRFVLLRNMRSAIEHPVVIDEYLATEIAKCRVAGPFATPPFPDLHCSPFRVIPNKRSTW